MLNNNAYISENMISDMRKWMFLGLCIFLIGCAQQIELPPGEMACREDTDCTKSGCSGTICQSKNDPLIVTTCEWLDEYTCYREVDCGCVNNKCIWDDQEALESCLASY